MSKREFRLLLMALGLRALTLIFAFLGVVVLLYVSPEILALEGGSADTVKTLLGAGLAVFSGAAFQLSTSMSRDYTEFIANLRSAAGQEDEK